MKISKTLPDTYKTKKISQEEEEEEEAAHKICKVVSQNEPFLYIGGGGILLSENDHKINLVVVTVLY